MRAGSEDLGPSSGFAGQRWFAEPMPSGGSTRTRRRGVLIATAVYFVAGLLISEWWFGWATAEELQPNIDGLSRDETLLTWIPGIVAVFVIRHHARRRVDRQPHPKVG